MWLAILIVIVLSLLVLGFSFWNIAILIQQKKTWEAFAKKHQLVYEGRRFMDPPVARGKIEGYTTIFYTDVQPTPDIRGQRYVTVIEIEIGHGIPATAALGTSKMKEFINGLTLTKNYVPDHPDWNEEYIGRTKNLKKLKTYMHKERLDVLMKLFKMKNATVLFFFDEIDGVLRIETSDPLRETKHMDKIVTRLIRDMNVLSPTVDEKKLVPKPVDDEDEDEDDEEEEATRDPHGGRR